MTPLSPHFSLEELVHSQIAARKGVPNEPDEAQLANLLELCTVLLEPAREVLGCILHVDSGFRSPILNSLVGGAVDSAHMDGRAADVIPIGVELHEAFERLRRSPTLPYDEIIIECDAWIHLQIAKAADPPRRRALTAAGSPGHWTYTLISGPGDIQS